MPAPEASSATETHFKTCSCGHNRHHALVVRKNKYSAWGWLALLTGVTVKPIFARYQCTRCNEIFDETDDPAELSKYLK
ncbi:MAG: hypothetical protein JSR44_01520 [Spirochaetes bacterium]|nr:hypothetical protein [Spirochaetota bacterium]